MTTDYYQQAVALTINRNLTSDEQRLHALYGIASEAGKLNGIYQKAYQDREIDGSKLINELGDLLWFIVEYCNAMDWTLENIMMTNIQKLRKRYPNGFEEERSLHRKNFESNSNEIEK